MNKGYAHIAMRKRLLQLCENHFQGSLEFEIFCVLWFIMHDHSTENWAEVPWFKHLIIVFQSLFILISQKIALKANMIGWWKHWYWFGMLSYKRVSNFRMQSLLERPLLMTIEWHPPYIWILNAFSQFYFCDLLIPPIWLSGISS